MSSKTGKPSEIKLKRLSKSKRTHARRLNQEAHKMAGTTSAHA